MLKRTIMFEDFNGVQSTEVYYFNLSKSELIELEVGYKAGLQAALTKIIEAEDKASLIAEFKKIILLAYGIKSEDGKRFIKSDELRKEFEQTAAYQQLFMELALDESKAAEFINGVLPKDMTIPQDKPIQPPPLPGLDTSIPTPPLPA
jgi:hypothetical protein